MSSPVTDHTFTTYHNDSDEALCKFPVKLEGTPPMQHAERCARPKGDHAPGPHAWRGRAADAGSNTPCQIRECGQLRLAKVHSGYGVEHLSATPGHCKTCPPGTECPKWHHDADERSDGRKDAATFYAVQEEEPAEEFERNEAVAAWDAYSAMVRELLVEKSGYGDSWKRQGYMGNVGRVLSKADRLRNLMWKDGFAEEPQGESILDTMLDIGPLAAFAIANLREGNRWGR